MSDPSRRDAALEAGLLSCPWPDCGSDPSVIVQSVPLLSRGKIAFQGHVECDDCGAHGPYTAGYSGDMAKSKAKASTEAVTLWNSLSRPLPTPPRQA